MTLRVIIQKKQLLVFLLTTLCLWLCIYFFFVRHLESIYSFFNSDSLEIPYLYKDLFIKHGSFKDWNFSSVNYFFPDALIFFVMAFLVKNLNFAILLWNIILLFLSYVFIVAIGCLIGGKENKNLFRFSALIFLFLAPYIGQEIFLPLGSSHYGSTVVIHLINLYLILRLLNQSKFIYYLLLGLSCFLTNLSDLLFIVTFIGPVLMSLLVIAWFVDKPNRIILIKIFLTIAITGPLGYFTNVHDLLHLHIGHQHVIVHFAHAWTIFRTNLIIFYNDHPIIILIDILYVIVVLTILLKLLFSKQYLKLNYYTLNELNSSTVFVLMSLCFCTILTVLAVLVFDRDLFAVGVHSLLHLEPAILFPVFLGLPILIIKYSNVGEAVNRVYLFLVVSLIICLCLFNQNYSIKGFVNRYPPLTQCLDNYARTGRLISKNGVEVYWDARINTFLSKENVNIVATFDLVHPTNWMSTKRDYLDKTFNFVILDEEALAPIKITKTLGKPDLILICPVDSGQRSIYIYKKGFNLIKKVKRSGQAPSQ